MATLKHHNGSTMECRFVEDMFNVTRGSTCSVRSCRICGHMEIYRYTGGHRGAGMVGGNKARGRIIQHIKTAHPEQYAAVMVDQRAFRTRKVAS